MASLKLQVNADVRRISVPDAPTYLWLRAKAQEVDAALHKKQFTLVWADGEGDCIRIANDDDLRTALQTPSQRVLKIMVRPALPDLPTAPSAVYPALPGRDRPPTPTGPSLETPLDTEVPAALGAVLRRVAEQLPAQLAEALEAHLPAALEVELPDASFPRGTHNSIRQRHPSRAPSEPAPRASKTSAPPRGVGSLLRRLPPLLRVALVVVLLISFGSIGFWSLLACAALVRLAGTARVGEAAGAWERRLLAILVALVCVGGRGALLVGLVHVYCARSKRNSNNGDGGSSGSGGGRCTRTSADQFGRGGFDWGFDFDAAFRRCAAEAASAPRAADPTPSAPAAPAQGTWATQEAQLQRMGFQAARVRAMLQEVQGDVQAALAKLLE